MADGRGKMEWAQTSNLMAMIVNVMRDPKKSKAASASEFNPYQQKKHAGKAPLSILRDIWTEKEREKRPGKGENSKHRIREFPTPGVLCFMQVIDCAGVKEKEKRNQALTS